MKTRAEMEADYGSVPPAITKGVAYRWTICRAHADVSWTTTDGGETWAKGSIVWAAERARRDDERLEMQRIQRELKG